MLKKQNIRYRPFTLIEMLMVLVIVSILTFVALPAFESLAKGQGVTLAARELGAKLKAARSYAISKRKYIAVLMPRANLPEKYLFQQYRACEVTKSNTTPATYTFKCWAPGDKWNLLPSNTGVIQIRASTDSIAFTGNYPDVGAYKTVDSCGEDGAGANSVRAIIFKPSGLPVVDSDSSISIGAGKCSGGSFTCTNLNNYYDIEVAKYTGRISFTSN